MVIISAPWVIPIDTPIIQDGCVVIADCRIIDIGKRDDIVKTFPHIPITPYPGVLMPGLVNAHTHLELSHLNKTIEPVVNQKITDWIDSLILQRAANESSLDRIVESFTTLLQNQHNSGVALIGDIGNEYYEKLHRLGGEIEPRVFRLLEYLGPNVNACQLALKKLNQLDDKVSATGHAPYSTAPELLQAIKKRCRRLKQLFSIHTSESPDENEFIRCGTGAFRNFLEKKKSWDGVFPFAKGGYSNTIEYFDFLGLLDDKTLLVHCVHLSQKEIRLIKEKGSNICLCPGSNQFLDVGLAPVEQMVELGLLPALGTDSPASNQRMDIWWEMQLLVEKHANLQHSDVLAMATLGGARALLQEGDFGSLSVGKKSKFIHVSSASLEKCSNEKLLIKELVSGGQPSIIEWV